MRTPLVPPPHPVGINDSKLLYVLVAMCGAVFTLFVTNGNSIEDGDDDFFGEIDNRR